LWTGTYFKKATGAYLTSRTAVKRLFSAPGSIWKTG